MKKVFFNSIVKKDKKLINPLSSIYIRDRLPMSKYIRVD